MHRLDGHENTTNLLNLGPYKCVDSYICAETMRTVNYCRCSVDIAFCMVNLVWGRIFALGGQLVPLYPLFFALRISAFFFYG